MPAARKLTPAEAIAKGRRILAARQTGQRLAQTAKLVGKPCAMPSVIETTVLVRSPVIWPKWVWRRPVVKVSPSSSGIEFVDIDATKLIHVVTIECEKSAEPTIDGGAQTEAGIPISEQDQGLGVMPNHPGFPGGSQDCEIAQNRKLTGDACRTDTANRPKYSDPIPEGGREDEAGIPVPKLDQVLEVVVSDPEFPDSSMQPSPTPPPDPQHSPGAWPITDLRASQCRFACQDIGGGAHLFCGQPTQIRPGNQHGSWCDEHLAHVWQAGSSLKDRRRRA